MKPLLHERRWLPALLLLALLWAQAVGLAHRSAHGLHSGARVVEGASVAQAGVFGHEDDQTAQCRLFDQLALGEPLSPAGDAVAPAAGSQRAVAPTAGWAPVSPCAAYQARAPPAIG